MVDNAKHKNEKIEFLRFVFCMCIILFHINRYCFDSGYMITDSISFFQHGNIGVEFFFLVTGYLFASYCFKRRDISEPIGKSTVTYVYKKWSSVFPYHVIAFFLTFFGVVITEQLGVGAAITRFIDALPNFFLIQKTGIYARNILGLEWYLSVMLLSLLILYPICKKNYDIFTRIIAPVIGVFLIGYLSHTYGRLTGTGTWGNYFAACQIRGFAEICLGAFGFEVARFIKKFNYTKTCKIVFTIIENGCYLFAFFFICSTWDNKYEAYVLYALLIGICFTFSEVTYWNSSLFQCKVVEFLGALSLSLYLSQNFVRSLVIYFCSDLRIRYQIIVIIAGIFLVALGVYFLGNRISIKIKRWANKLMKNANNSTALKNG